MIFDSKKLKNIFSSKKVEKEDNKISTQDNKISTQVYTISNSDSAYLCSLAAKTCYNLEVGDTYKKNIDHVKRIMGYGHDSICAHSNIIGLIDFGSNSIDTLNVESLLNAIPGMRFMNCAILPYENIDYEKWYDRYLLISGSIRAFRYFFIKTNELRNFSSGYYSLDETFRNEIIRDLILPNIEKEFFEDIIKDDSNNLKEIDFSYRPYFYNMDVVGKDEDVEIDINKAKILHQKVYSSDHVDLLYKDNISDIANEIRNCMFIRGNQADNFYEALLDACLKCGIVTIRLKNYSRAISQQINRHLSGISQESQRYVDYSNTQFIDPLPFNPKVYPDPNKKYHIDLKGNSYDLTSKELGQMLISIYPQLKEQGMVNQEARSFLPMNSETKTIHTFTFENLLHFIHLRASSAAQPEVQCIANEIRDLLIESINNDWSDSNFDSDRWCIRDKVINKLKNV